MSEEAISESDLEPSLNSEEEYLENEEEEDIEDMEEDEDENDGDDEDDSVGEWLHPSVLTDNACCLVNDEYSWN